MNALHYRPGEWFALVRPAHLVLLPADTAATHVSALWEQMDDAATVESLLTGILAMAEMKISSMPPFAIVSREDAPHVVLRGVPAVATTGGSEQACGRDVATWLERRFGDDADADGWEVGTGAEDGGHWLPIAEGIVRVSRLRHGADPEAAASPTGAACVAQPGPQTGIGTHQDTAATARSATPLAAPATVVSTAAPATTATGAESEAPGPDAAAESAAPADASAGGPSLEPGNEPVAEARDAAEAHPVEASGQSAEGTAETGPKRGGAPQDLEKVSLASELLGRREDQMAQDVATGTAEPLAEDPDNADTILTSRVPKRPTPEVAAFQPAEPVLSAAPFKPASPVQPAAPVQPAGMIGSMPWMRKPATEPLPAQDVEGDDDGNTILRSGLPAAKPARPADEGPADEAPAEEAPADEAAQAPLIDDVPAPGTLAEKAPADDVPEAGHDEGLTLTGHNSTSAPREFVLARSCRNGHPNPPTAVACKKCGARLDGEAHQMPRPPLGRMVIADGPDGRETTHELTRSVLLGRQPSARALPGDQHPQLVQVQSPSSDISRNHLQVRIEGWHVELVDMGATNGSILLRAGHSPRRLARHESVMLLDGDVADLGDGVVLRFEELP